MMTASILFCVLSMPFWVAAMATVGGKHDRLSHWLIWAWMAMWGTGAALFVIRDVIWING